MMIKYYILAACVVLLKNTYAQIPVEVFTGHEKATFDIMFFNYFKEKQGENSKFLFFSRTRASVDYEQNSNGNLPQFGFTEALSYNLPSLKGFAPVAVAQILNRGVYAKAGIQYVHIRNEFTMFSWFVVETTSTPTMDVFLLIRYTPPLTDRLHLFTQLEIINVFATEHNGMNNFIQRLRFGLKMGDWQFGIGSDFSQSGNTTYTAFNNPGIFLRYVFHS